MIVEFYGLPGSGKTTCARECARTSGWRLVTVRSRAELVLLNVLFVLAYPVRSARLLAAVVRNSGSRGLFRLKLTNTFLHHNAQYMKARNYGRALIDQGHFQNIISVPEQKMTEQELKRYIHLFPRPDILLVFAIDHRERERRLTTRGYVPRERFSAAYRAAWQNVIEYNDALFRNMLSALGVPYVIVSGDMSSKDVSALIAEHTRS